MNANYKRFYRSREESQVAGVCGGLGEYFQVDPTLIRLGVVAATLLTGAIPGLLAYAAAWIVVPLEPLPVAHDPMPRTHEGSA